MVVVPLVCSPVIVLPLGATGDSLAIVLAVVTVLVLPDPVNTQWADALGL